MKTFSLWIFTFQVIFFSLLNAQAQLIEPQYTPIQTTSVVQKATLDLLTNDPLNRFAADQTERFLRAYQKIDPFAQIEAANSARAWPSLKLRKPGEPRTLVVVVHGFIASPFEVADLASELARSTGYDVYCPLIFGFGSSPKVAGSVSREQWRQVLKGELEALNKGYSRLHLVGFSLGAALSLDYLRNTPPERHPLSLTLISPFIEPALPLKESLFDLIADSVGSWQEWLSPSWIYKLTKHPDLYYPSKYPDNYLASIPLRSVQEILALSQEILHWDKPFDFKRSVQVFGSTADKTVNLVSATSLLSKLFAPGQVEWEWVKGSPQPFPHQLGYGLGPAQIVPLMAKKLTQP